MHPEVLEGREAEIERQVDELLAYSLIEPTHILVATNFKRLYKFTVAVDSGFIINDNISD